MKKSKKKIMKYGTDILKKLIELRSHAKDSSKISDSLIEDLRIVVALRGLIAHYTVQEEHPNNKDLLSKLEKFENRLLGNKINGIVSTERILAPQLALSSQKLVIEVIDSLYKSGYEPPRPRWIEIIDPQRFNKGH